MKGKKLGKQSQHVRVLSTKKGKKKDYLVWGLGLLVIALVVFVVNVSKVDEFGLTDWQNMKLKASEGESKSNIIGAMSVLSRSSDIQYSDWWDYSCKKSNAKTINTVVSDSPSQKVTLSKVYYLNSAHQPNPCEYKSVSETFFYTTVCKPGYLINGIYDQRMMLDSHDYYVCEAKPPQPASCNLEIKRNLYDLVSEDQTGSITKVTKYNYDWSACKVSTDVSYQTSCNSYYVVEGTQFSSYNSDVVKRCVPKKITIYDFTDDCVSSIINEIDFDYKKHSNTLDFCHTMLNNDVRSGEESFYTFPVGVKFHRDDAGFKPYCTLTFVSADVALTGLHFKSAADCVANMPDSYFHPRYAVLDADDEAKIRIVSFNTAALPQGVRQDVVYDRLLDAQLKVCEVDPAHFDCLALSKDAQQLSIFGLKPFVYVLFTLLGFSALFIYKHFNKAKLRRYRR